MTQSQQHIETTTDQYVSLLPINGFTCSNMMQSRDINQASSNKQYFGGLQHGRGKLKTCTAQGRADQIAIHADLIAIHWDQITIHQDQITIHWDEITIHEDQKYKT